MFICFQAVVKKHNIHQVEHAAEASPQVKNVRHADSSPAAQAPNRAVKRDFAGLKRDSTQFGRETSEGGLGLRRMESYDNEQAAGKVFVSLENCTIKLYVHRGHLCSN